MEFSARRKPRSSMKCDLISQAMKDSTAVPDASESRYSGKTKVKLSSEICSGSSWCSVPSAHLSPLLFHPGEGWKIGRAFCRRVFWGRGTRFSQGTLVFKSSPTLDDLKQRPLYFCLVKIHDVCGPAFGQCWARHAQCFLLLWHQRSPLL